MALRNSILNGKIANVKEIAKLEIEQHREREQRRKLHFLVCIFILHQLIERLLTAVGWASVVPFNAVR